MRIDGRKQRYPVSWDILNATQYHKTRHFWRFKGLTRWIYLDLGESCKWCGEMFFYRCGADGQPNGSERRLDMMFCSETCYSDHRYETWWYALSLPQKIKHKAKRWIHKRCNVVLSLCQGG